MSISTEKEKPSILEIGQAENAVNEQGYTIDSLLEEHGNHFTYKVDYDGKPFIFKINKDQSFQETRTKVEATWNRVLNAIPNKPFLVPSNITSGEHLGHFWFVTDFFEGASLHIINARHLLTEEHMRAAANIHRWILNSGIVIEPKDSNRRSMIAEEGEDTQITKLVNLAKEWESKFDQEVSDLLLILSSKKTPIKWAPVHGDYSLKHLILLQDGSYGLIDGELGCGNYYKYYDTAYFFHRTYVGSENPEMVRTFLANFINLLNADEVADFEDDIMYLMAQRCIGGYMDYRNDPVKVELNRQFHEEVSTRKILS